MSEATAADKAFLAARFDEAVEGFTARLAGRPDDAKARAKLCVALYETGRTEAALDAGEQVLAALPPESPANLLVALVLVETGRRDRAREVLAAVRAVDGENSFAAGLEALALLKEGKVAEALPILDRGVFESPLFRAHLLAEVEDRLARLEKPADWQAGYLETVL
jgi:thioredoxin-like negative regulator of GroEL